MHESCKCSLGFRVVINVHRRGCVKKTEGLDHRIIEQPNTRKPLKAILDSRLVTSSLEIYCVHSEGYFQAPQCEVDYRVPLASPHCRLKVFWETLFQQQSLERGHVSIDGIVYQACVGRGEESLRARNGEDWIILFRLREA